MKFIAKILAFSAMAVAASSTVASAVYFFDEPEMPEEMLK